MGAGGTGAHTRERRRQVARRRLSAVRSVAAGFIPVRRSLLLKCHPAGFHDTSGSSTRSSSSQKSSRRSPTKPTSVSSTGFQQRHGKPTVGCDQPPFVDPVCARTEHHTQRARQLRLRSRRPHKWPADPAVLCRIGQRDDTNRHPAERRGPEALATRLAAPSEIYWCATRNLTLPWPTSASSTSFSSIAAALDSRKTRAPPVSTT
jgi:hypothetical protein